MAVYTYADEAARKKAAGIPLNNGVIPKTANQASKTVNNPMSAGQASAGTSKTAATVGVIPGTITGAASGGMKQAQGMSASAAGVGTNSQGAIPPIYNTATNTTGKAPELGYGSGGTYGQTAGLGDAYKANSALISTDAGKQSEIARTQAVIEARKAAGLDTSGQEKYLSVNLGYKPEEAASGVVPMNGMLTSDQIAQEAQYKLDKERADLENATNTQSNTVKNNADYANKLINDSRVLEDQRFDRNANPFSGKTSYDKAVIGRGRGIDDTFRGSELTNQLNSISQDLYNFDKLAPDKQRALINEATRIEREYGLQVGALTGQIPGMGSSGQTLASKQFDYSKTRDQVADNQWNQAFDLQKTQQEWDNAFAQGQFDFQKAQTVWDNNFKDKSFEQSMKDAAASRGLQWASLNQRQKEFIADSAFREKQFKYEQEQDSQGGKNYNYKTDPEFADDVQYATTNPQALAELKANSSTFIKKYGPDGYDELLKYATPEKENPLSKLFE